MQAGGAGGADAAARAVEEALVEGGRKINCGRCQLVGQGRAGKAATAIWQFIEQQYMTLGVLWLDSSWSARDAQARPPPLSGSV